MTMRALHLNFVRRRSGLRNASIVLLTIALAVCGCLGYAYRDLSANLDTWEAQWRRAQKSHHAQTSTNQMPLAQWEQLQTALKAANRVISRIGQPWDTLFQEIDALVNEQITLLSVEPDTERQEVRITAEAKDFAAMLDYEKRLQASTAFRESFIASHQIQQQDVQRPVRFVLAAQWKVKPVPGVEADNARR